VRKDALTGPGRGASLCAVTESMVGFGYKQAWLAVRDGDADRLLAALGLRDLGTARRRSGCRQAWTATWTYSSARPT